MGRQIALPNSINNGWSGKSTTNYKQTWNGMYVVKANFTTKYETTLPNQSHLTGLWNVHNNMGTSQTSSHWLWQIESLFPQQTWIRILEGIYHNKPRWSFLSKAWEKSHNQIRWATGLNSWMENSNLQVVIHSMLWWQWYHQIRLNTECWKLIDN